MDDFSIIKKPEGMEEGKTFRAKLFLWQTNQDKLTFGEVLD
jgi:hypothetical protein